MPTAETARREGAAALRAVRELWGELLVAIETPPADVWPPRQLAHTLRPVADSPVVERAPLILREHPAPLNVTALDAGIAVEQALFDLADTLAAAVQRAPLDDPRRWKYRSQTAPGSRAHGLHWAALWIEGRLLDEDTEPGQQLDGTLTAAPYLPLPEHLLHEAHRVALTAEARVLRALGLDQRETPIPDRPCPWCGGELTVHTGPDEPPTVTCVGGASCSAPVALDLWGRRVWEWSDLMGLADALDASEGRGDMARVA
ncbi:hypothetical protein SSP35_05_02350 [Streptomyces sp. NBRC 110611]|uniref:hypothetical protein n=1 Tax=Streptomyces sp. NBRC 110611 TaxID=1621259 RepID=UPI00082B845F|nr:hypothetical protein [Streptomyces sp. NBRC 110611]GAU67668.1 hypothetical protein SSP35_05_02350 [Streptomyces sp. NBRC 110611]